MRKIICFGLILMLSTLSLSLFAQIDNGANPENGDDKTLSPYFFVKSDDPGIDALPLLSTRADVRIVGVIADVTVKQTYKNSGKKPLEAIYTFPASTRAAVYEMTMKIGKRLLKAEIQEKQKARETYEKAKKEGRSASLLEQQRPNVFQMNVANIMPGDLIEIEMKYTELLIPDDGVYEFVYPTVVGPRYSNEKSKTAKDENKFVESPYTRQGKEPFYDFDIKVDITAGMSLSDVSSPSHEEVIKYKNNQNTEAEITLAKGQNKSGNKDFVLNYKLSGDKIQTGLLLSHNDKENFFLLMLQPPKKIRKEEIPPREYIFVIDVSGSMNGFPLDISKAMIKQLLGSLKENDLFNVLLFAGSSRFMDCQSVPATKDNIDKAIDLINRERGGGGTELMPALQKVYNNPKASGYSRSVIILTDGYVTVEKEAFEIIRNNLDKSNAFAFGIGTAVNRFLIDGIARSGNGEPFYVLHPKYSDSVKSKFLKYIESPVLTDVKVDFKGFNAYDVQPMSIADVMEQRPIIIYGKYNGAPQGTITVIGKMADRELHVDIPVKVFAGDESNGALRYLWARNKIAEISDYLTLQEDSANIIQVTNLGLKYNLLTKYTSFVAVDYEVRNNGQEIVKVNQPLPLPEGVSDYAVGENLSVRGSRGNPVSAGGYSASPMILQKSSGYTTGTAEISPLEPEQMSEKDIAEANKLHLQNLNNEFSNYFVYPPKALEKGIGGKVIMWILIDESGKCVYTEIVQTQSGGLFRAASDAMKKITFTSKLNVIKHQYNWKKLEIEFNPKNKSADIISEQNSFSVNGDFKFLDTKPGSGNGITKGDTVTIRYSAMTSDCLQLEKDKIFVVILGDGSLNPVLELMITGMKKGGVRTATVSDAFFKPENNGINEYDNRISIEIEIINIKLKK